MFLTLSSRLFALAYCHLHVVAGLELAVDNFVVDFFAEEASVTPGVRCLGSRPQVAQVAPVFCLCTSFFFGYGSKAENIFFPRKHGEGFFRWVHLSCSHESHYKVSLQGIIIIKVIARSHCKESLQGVIARSHCKESLQGVMARSHCKESWQGVMARSHGKESWQGVIARSHCKESLQGVIARSHGKESLQGVIARSHCKESLQGVIARSHCKESWQGLQLALDSLHLQLALDPLHLQLALDSLHLQLALDSLHLQLALDSMSQLALDSMHLASCTWLLAIATCT